MKIKTQDKVVRAVLRKIDERSLKGQAKYGAMMHEEVDGGDDLTGVAVKTSFSF